MFDIRIENGLIADGTRRKAYKANLYVKDGKIAEISEEVKEAAEVLDAKGHVVAPGFVDIHTHSDIAYRATPYMDAKLRSGVTCELYSNCGSGKIPLTEKNIDTMLGYNVMYKMELNKDNFPVRDVDTYVEDIAKHGIAINASTMVGHGTLRSAVIGWEMRQLTPGELDEMCALLDKLLTQGAAGVSFGLIYAPGSFCDTEEIVALAKVCAKHDKLLSVHMRNENLKVFEALDEMIEVGRRTGVKIEISHLKLMGQPQWGRAKELLAKIDLARAEGVRIHADQYPYTFSNSGLTSSFPVWTLDGGYQAFADRLADDATWQKILATGLPEMKNRGGAENIIVCDCQVEEIIGKSLPEIAEMYGLELYEAIRKILIDCHGRISCFYKNMSDADILTILSRPDVCIVSDGEAYDLNNYGGRPHPRNTGATPRGLRLIRENNLMPMEDAIYKVTRLPATLMGFGNRFGTLEVGKDATITVFDWDNLTDCSTLQEPNLETKGIDFVVVNGELVLDHGKYTGKLPGKMLRA